MNFDNPIKYQGYQVSATATQDAVGERFHGAYTIQQGEDVILRGAHTETFGSVAEAEQQALALAHRVIDGEVPGVRLKPS